ncbi:PA14 domain-containing protein [Thalassoroseus pseudoceratinae]|uniref:PA14 domain-containing protein n=1 Tax=Thalassoroseus pseudoceratinae TaxID=2713176 RepID=UPI00141E671F|nr:PA14 domain-containing protein [Thalassoroseus pseudoceratinae]
MKSHFDWLVRAVWAFSLALNGCFGWSLVVSAAEPASLVVGWDPTDGHVLLGELNCLACHKTGEDFALPVTKDAPNLKTVGQRVTPQYLTRYLADPQEIKPGTPMPHLLHSLPDGEKNKTVTELTHYLVSLGGPIDQRASGASSSQIHAGEELFHSIGCVACHQPMAQAPQQDRDLPAGLELEDLIELNLPGTAPPKPSIPLGGLAMKTTVSALSKFLKDPLQTRPSGRMPHLNLDSGEAQALAAYLLRDQYDESAQSVGSGLDFEFFEGKVSKSTDLENKEPTNTGTVKNFDLTQFTNSKGVSLKNTVKGGAPDNFAIRFHGAIEIPQDGEYRFWTKSDDGSVLRIGGKLIVSNEGVHAPVEKTGQVKLTKGRHSIEVIFYELGGGHELTVNWQPPGKKRGKIPADALFHDTAAMLPKGIAEGEQFQVDPELAKRGKEKFVAIGCANCHSTGETRVQKIVKVDLNPANVEGNRGCLSDDVGPGRPRFAFSNEQRSALRKTVASLSDWHGPETAAEKIDYSMAALNCYRCHERDDKGGPDLLRSNYFGYLKHVDLGDEGRLPPPLDHVGVKLTDVGFREMLLNGQKYRTYMAARMPRFGRENVLWMAKSFNAADAGEVPSRQIPFNKNHIRVGRQLTGKKGLACINCHAYGEYRLPGAEGLDLLNVTRRIQPGYFHAFLKDPQGLKPRTRMPSGWPDGRSAYQDLLDGNADAQIDSIWAYLSVGEKGGLPSGLSPNNTNILVPTDEPITFRSFLDGVGSHCILVGFPERTNVAFDANRIRTVVAWPGDFISARESWEGRGGQYAKIPSSNPMWLPDGPPLARLPSGESEWPKDVPKGQKIGSNRTLEGWQFKGYRFDKNRVPTFLYQMPGGIEVEETYQTELVQDGTVLIRKLQISSTSDIPDLYFLAARGDAIQADTEREFVIDGDVRCQIASGTDSMPITRPVGNQKELLLPIRFENRDGKNVATFEVKMTW